MQATEADSFEHRILYFWLYFYVFVICSVLPLRKPRRLQENYKRRSNNKALIQNIVDMMVRNTVAGKHWLLGEDESSESSDDKESESSVAGQEHLREEGEVSNSDASEDPEEPDSGGEAEQEDTSEVKICSQEYSSSYLNQQSFRKKGQKPEKYGLSLQNPDYSGDL